MSSAPASVSFAKQPDRVGIGRRCAKIEAQKAQPTQPVADQIFHPRVADVVLRREHQDLEHCHRIIWRAAALRAVAIGQRGNQNRAKHLEVDEPAQLL